MKQIWDQRPWIEQPKTDIENDQKILKKIPDMEKDLK